MTNYQSRLEAVRHCMAERNYDALIVPRADEYLGEYMPAHNERLRWVSGFTGSAGAVVILSDRAAIFVDGRYTVQVRREVAAELFGYHDLVEEPFVEWLVAELPAGARVTCDPRLHSLRWYRGACDKLETAGIDLVTDTDNLVDHCWEDRPAPVVKPAILLGSEYSGESVVEKQKRIAGAISARGADAALVFAPDSLSWLLNIRGTDIPCLPVVQGLAMVEANGEVTLFVDARRIPPGFDEHVGESVRVLPETEAAAALSAYDGLKVLADPEAANAWAQLTLEQGGATLIAGQDPVLMPKACKNPVELAGARRAHVRDAVAEVRFLAWLDGELAADRLHDEATLSDKLGGFRAAGEEFRDFSFDTISAAGPNAALCHYNHRNAEPAGLQADSVYLFDSGGQYTDGTTDITRTVAIGDPGPEVRRMFTLVLKGHIALARARFPEGTTGAHLDVLARQYLWREGHDFAHGTGHGVGSFLSVHEGPQRIARPYNGVALRPGMIISNEPGFYREGAYGIRCENLVAVREAGGLEGDMPALEFETLTLVPFDRRMLDLSLLAADEIAWLDDYHQRVRETIGPLLEGAARGWLEAATRPLG